MSDMKARPVKIILTKVMPVKIVLDKPRNLIFDLNAFEELENIYGDTHAAFEALQSDKGKIKHLKNFLFAGLVHEDETLTPQKIGTMLGWNNMGEMSGKIWEAIGGALPEPKEDGEDKPGE